ncbi:hypothetical protein [Bradyrhizobium retamae]|uniref:Uncharacterized protein n=1 Tax=Bradyrhizobium retamae TaxID=1300035 RepID=A0A0R3N135_9BRAD|nr:hypothetical protein [Bradyrhizobium retamae]KRR26002.1 hypothetical protein CQ13_23600 [Bradyrhizobium retamae]
MKLASAAAAVAAITILISPVTSFAQSAGGTSAGSPGTTGSPGAGSAGVGTPGVTGVSPSPTTPGGLNNAGQDPSGTANPSRLAPPPPPGTNTAGTAQSSGRGVTTGSARPGSSTDDAVINEENKTVDRKMKGICRGC